MSLPLPITLRALILAALAVVILLAVRSVFSHLLRADRVELAQEVAGLNMDAMATLYGVLAAFILTGAWERFDNLRITLVLEASAVANLRQIARVLPEPPREAFAVAVETYRMRSLEEVPLLAEGKRNQEVDPAIDRLWLILLEFEPTTAGEIELQSRAFGALEELGDQRLALFAGLRRPVPSILWLILIGGAVAVLGLSMVSSIGGRLPAGYFALLVALISLALYAIYALSYPVRSGLSAELVPMIDKVLLQPP